MLELSALQWKKNNGKIILYTDSPMEKYLGENNILNAWDEVNTEILDNFERKYPNIDTTIFWSAAKFACYQEIKTPFVCVDTDLIVWKKLQFPLDLAFSFSHWELVEEGDQNYPPLSAIKIPSHYNFHKECHYSTKATNMSITYLGNENFKNKFTTEAISFMTNNKINCQNKYATPEILYMEQRIPLAISHEMGLNYEPIINSVWSPKQGKFIEFDQRYGEYFLATIDDTKPFTHLWFHKTYLQSNAKARNKYCRDLKKKIEETRIENETIKIK